MTSSFIFSLIAIIYLKILNSLQIKTKFCLDRVSLSEKHKLFTNLKKDVPLSGFFFFLPVIFYFFR